MRAFFLSGSILLTAMILIIAFENIGTKAQGFLFLFAGVDSGFLIVFGITILGILAGIFYTGLVLALIKGKPEDEESPGAEW
jgi:hypothetical protein